MSSIPVSQLVQVNPGVLAPAGTLNDLIGLILSNSTYVPIGTTQEFADAADVGAYFGLSSNEYQDALIYFDGPNNATKAPSTLLFGQYNSAAVGAYLRGGNPGLTLAQLQALTGTLTITINGTANTSSTINLSSATSFSNAATIIQAAFTSPAFNVTYDAQHGAFLFTSTTTGHTSTAAFATTAALATSLGLTSASAGAVISQGADAATPATAMAQFAAVDQTWSTFMTTFEPNTSDATAFSAWTSLQNNRYAYIGWDSDPNAKIAGNTTTWGYAIQQAQYGGSVPIWGDQTHAAFVLSYAASLDFSRLNGRTTLAYQGQDGLVPAVNNATDAEGLLANGYNFYGVYATGVQQFNMVQNGSVSGQYDWLDSYLNQIWLRANLQLALMNLLMSAGSIPYNQAGYSMIEAAIMDPVAAAVNFGMIRTGVTLSASQTQEVNQAVGKTIAPTLQVAGYYVDIQPASPSTRLQRGSPPITLYYTDGQSVQNIVMAAIDVQ